MANHDHMLGRKIQHQRSSLQRTVSLQQSLQRQNSPGQFGADDLEGGPPAVNQAQRQADGEHGAEADDCLGDPF